MRILLVDDHKLFRDGLRGLLGGRPGLEIAGEAGDGEAAVRAVQERKPDIVLMDISMPGMNGIEATRQIVAARPATLAASTQTLTPARRARLVDAGGQPLRPDQLRRSSPARRRGGSRCPRAS